MEETARLRQEETARLLEETARLQQEETARPQEETGAQERKQAESPQEEGGKRQMGRTAEFLKNSAIAIFKGEFLLRLRFHRYFLHILYLFLLAAVSIWLKLEIEQTMARMEENKVTLEDYKIYHTQKTCELVSLDRISTLEDMLEKSGSRLGIPEKPADKIK